MAFKGRWNFLLAVDKYFCSSGRGKTQTLFSFRIKLFHLLQKLKLCNVIFPNFNKLNNLLVGCMKTSGKLCIIWSLKEMIPYPTFLTLLWGPGLGQSVKVSGHGSCFLGEDKWRSVHLLRHLSHHLIGSRPPHPFVPTSPSGSQAVIFLNIQMTNVETEFSVNSEGAGNFRAWPPSPVPARGWHFLKAE